MRCIAVAVKRRIGGDLGRAPIRLSRLLSEGVDGGVVLVLAAAPVVDDHQVAIVELSDSGRVLVLVGRLRADHFLDLRLAGWKCGQKQWDEKSL